MSSVPTADVRPVRGRLDLRSGCPTWMLRDGMGETGPRLLGAHTADIVVLGAGISSAFVTRALAAAGLKVFVVDQRCPGLCCSSASTALLQYETTLTSVNAATMIRDRILGHAILSIRSSGSGVRRNPLARCARRRHERELNVQRFVPADLVGVATSLILRATLSAQIVKQWRERTVAGVSVWFFLGECAASIGFIVFSVLIGSWVVTVTNSLTLAAALTGQWVMSRNRRRAAHKRT